MNYNSWLFWLLFTVVIVAYWRLRHRQQNLLLLIGSYVFYGLWDYRFLILILISTVIDFIGGLGVAGVQLSAARLRKLGLLIVGSALFLCTPINYRQFGQALLDGNALEAIDCLPKTVNDFSLPLLVLGATVAYGAALPWLYALPEVTRRKTFLTISMVANLAILGFFKYCDFFLVSLKAVLDAIGLPVSWSTLGVILPAGISFYTFQAMSYTIDIYRGETKHTDNFLDFALFVCFFPHLVAGPIMRAHTLLPQVENERVLERGAAEVGFYLVLIGMFKKLVVADNLAPLVNAVFARFNGSAEATAPGGAEALVGLYAFAFQIYGDFSGYSSVARGIAKWLGFELVVNFNNPYLASSPREFWGGWHISLSTWLRDYLYVPLGGNREGALRTYRNLLLTMVLGGLWHGANWTYVAWGLYHGLLLCAFRLIPGLEVSHEGGWLHRFRRLIQVVVMFHLTCFGWLLFRADSLATIVAMTSAFLGPEDPGRLALGGLVLIVVFAGPMFLWEAMLGSEERLRDLPGGWMHRAALLIYLLVMLVIFRSEESYEFIYFQF